MKAYNPQQPILALFVPLFATGQQANAQLKVLKIIY